MRPELPGGLRVRRAFRALLCDRPECGPARRQEGLLARMASWLYLRTIARPNRVCGHAFQRTLSRPDASKRGRPWSEAAKDRAPGGCAGADQRICSAAQRERWQKLAGVACVADQGRGEGPARTRRTRAGAGFGLRANVWRQVERMPCPLQRPRVRRVRQGLSRVHARVLSRRGDRRPSAKELALRRKAGASRRVAPCRHSDASPRDLTAPSIAGKWTTNRA
jgi:hypothetical protein